MAVKQAQLGIWTASDNFFADNTGKSAAYYTIINNHLLLTFPDSGDYYTYFRGVVPQSYTGRAVWVKPKFTSDDAAESKYSYWHCDIQKHDLNDPLETEDYGTESKRQSDGSTSNYLLSALFASPAFQFSAGGFEAGDMFTLRLWREPGSVNDDLAQTAYLFSLNMVEEFS